MQEHKNQKLNKITEKEEEKAMKQEELKQEELNNINENKEEGLSTMEANPEINILEDEEVELEDTEESEKRNNILREHVYKTKSGKNFMKVLRTNEMPPYFVQHWENEEWVNGAKGLKYIPYRLPELIEGIERGETVFITNGEKDADTLTELGFCATTAPFSYEGRWTYGCNKYIKGAKVIIIKEKSEEAVDFAITTSRTVKKIDKKVKRLPIENICNKFGIEANDYTDITEIRETIKNDEELIKFFQKIDMQKRRS